MKNLSTAELSTTKGGLFKGCGKLKRAANRASKNGLHGLSSSLFYDWRECKNS